MKTKKNVAGTPTPRAETPRPAEKRIKVRALGGLEIPILGRATSGEVTLEEYKRLSRIKVDGKNYVEREEVS
jgi:hypothetical protein